MDSLQREFKLPPEMSWVYCQNRLEVLPRRNPIAAHAGQIAEAEERFGMVWFSSKQLTGMIFRIVQPSECRKFLREGEASLCAVRMILNCSLEVEGGSGMVAPVALTPPKRQQLVQCSSAHLSIRASGFRKRLSPVNSTPD
jgi:hypothetical protein